MSDRELEKQAERDLSLNDTLIEAYTKGARTMQNDCYAEVQSIADDLMAAHENEDWQEVAHIALDVIPRLFV